MRSIQMGWMPMTVLILLAAIAMANSVALQETAQTSPNPSGFEQA
jgi:hypothetical protein